MLTNCIPVPGITPYGGGSRWHRRAWVAKHGPIPKGLIVCHKCDNNMCRNEDHLYLGTYSDNMVDAVIRKRRPPRKVLTHCKRSHPLSGDNLWIRANGQQVCRECQRARVRKWRATRRGDPLDYLSAGSRVRDND